MIELLTQASATTTSRWQMCDQLICRQRTCAAALLYTTLS
jgi:hypothetical protein